MDRLDSKILVFGHFNYYLLSNLNIFENQHMKVYFQANIFHNLNDIFERHHLLNE